MKKVIKGWVGREDWEDGLVHNYGVVDTVHVSSFAVWKTKGKKDRGAGYWPPKKVKATIEVDE